MFLHDNKLVYQNIVYSKDAVFKLFTYNIVNRFNKSIKYF